MMTPPLILAAVIAAPIILLALTAAIGKVRRPKRHDIKRVEITYTGPFFVEEVELERTRYNALVDAELARQAAHFYAGKAAASRRYARNAATDGMRDSYLAEAADCDRQAKGYRQMAKDHRERARRCR